MHPILSRPRTVSNTFFKSLAKILQRSTSMNLQRELYGAFDTNPDRVPAAQFHLTNDVDFLSQALCLGSKASPRNCLASASLAWKGGKKSEWEKNYSGQERGHRMSTVARRPLTFYMLKIIAWFIIGELKPGSSRATSIP